MTAALAIAATSEVLRFVIEDAMIRAGRALNFNAPPVAIGPPPRPVPSGAGNGAAEPAAVNLFLHHVAPNPAWRNMHSPERDGQGRRLNNAPLVLDLHYLLSAHGSDIDREIGFGTAIHALHQLAVIPADLVRVALRALAGNTNPSRKIMAGEALADQFERLTVTPQALDVDTVTKIWTATQSPYRPSVGYLVTTVFLEDRLPARESLPVTAAGINIVPLARLSIDSVTGLKNGLRTAIVPGGQILVEGQGLSGDKLSVTLDDAALVADGAASHPDRLVFNLPSGLGVGQHYLEIARTVDAGGHMIKIGASAVSFLLRPAVDNPTAVVAPDPNNAALRQGTITLDLDPPAARNDAVSLQLTHVATGNAYAADWAAPAGAGPFAQLVFQATGVPVGAYIVGVKYGGISSQLDAAPDGALGPRVLIS